MRSAVDDLRARTVTRVLEMSVRERIALALRLGDEDGARFAATQGIPIAEALRQLANARSHGRRRSAND